MASHIRRYVMPCAPNAEPSRLELEHWAIDLEAIATHAETPAGVWVLDDTAIGTLYATEELAQDGDPEPVFFVAIEGRPQTEQGDTRDLAIDQAKQIRDAHEMLTAAGAGHSLHLNNRIVELDDKHRRSEEARDAAVDRETKQRRELHTLKGYLRTDRAAAEATMRGMQKQLDAAHKVADERLADLDLIRDLIKVATGRADKAVADKAEAVKLATDRGVARDLMRRELERERKARDLAETALGTLAKKMSAVGERLDQLQAENGGFRVASEASTTHAAELLAGRIHTLPEVERRLVANIIHRLELGRRRYGPWPSPDGRNLVRDAHEEGLDAALYLMAVTLQGGTDDGPTMIARRCDAVRVLSCQHLRGGSTCALAAAHDCESVEGKVWR